MRFTHIHDWKRLADEAETLGLRVEMRANSLKAMLEQREDFLDEVEAITNLAKKEDREFTEDEDERFTAIMDKEAGEITLLGVKIDAAQTREDEMKRIAALRTASRSDTDQLNRTQGDIDATDPKQPVQRVYHRMARLKAFPNTNEGAKAAYESGMWLRAIHARHRNERDQDAETFLKERGMTPQMAQTEGTDTAGGFTVPQPLSSTIIDIRETVGITRKLVDVVPMSSKTEDIPRRTGGLTVYYPGEGNTVTTSDMTFGRVNLVAIKRAVANQISNELSDDSLVNMTDRAVNEMGYALSLQEDNEFINGDGTSTYGGEQGVLDKLGSAGLFTAPTGESTWLLLSSASINQWFGTLPSQFHVSGQLAIVCSSQFYYNVFGRIMDAAGGNTGQMLASGFLSDLADAHYKGIPCFFTGRMPTTTAVSQNSALLGNFSMSVMLGDRVGIRIGNSKDYAFLDDVNTLLALTRYDINVHEPGDSSTAGGYVGLSTSSS